MDFAVRWVEGGATLNVVSLALGIAGIVSSIYFYLRSKHEKRPVFHTKTFPLLRDSVSRVPGLSILFEDKPVKTLSLTRLAIWNAGSLTIARDDIVKSDPLRIDGTAQGQILAARLSFSRRPATNLEANLVSNSILLSFDFLDRNDGGIIDIYHSEPLKISVLGIVRGSQSISIADPTVLWEQRVNKVLARLPDPDSFKYISFLVLLLYLPLLAALFIPLFCVLVYSKIFRSIPIEYSLESS